MYDNEHTIYKKGNNKLYNYRFKSDDQGNYKIGHNPGAGFSHI